MNEQPARNAATPKQNAVFFTISLIILGALVGLGFPIKGKRLFEEHAYPTVGSSTLLLAAVVNIIAWIPSSIYQTEHYYDLTGTLTYISCIVYSLGVSWAVDEHLSTRAIAASILASIWSLRLGAFLFARVRMSGRDTRFEVIKTQPVNFLMVFLIQALWASATALCVITVNCDDTQAAEFPSPIDVLGIVIWCIGFGIEIIADHQKSNFKAQASNTGNFISTGLWRYSRHPNYFGELTLWVGMFVLCASSFNGSQWICVISPIFVYLLLTQVSGVPLLEKAGQAKWGTDPSYVEYLETTSVFMIAPKLTKDSCAAKMLT